MPLGFFKHLAGVKNEYSCPKTVYPQKASIFSKIPDALSFSIPLTTADWSLLFCLGGHQTAFLGIFSLPYWHFLNNFLVKAICTSRSLASPSSRVTFFIPLFHFLYFLAGKQRLKSGRAALSLREVTRVLWTYSTSSFSITPSMFS